MDKNREIEQDSSQTGIFVSNLISDMTSYHYYHILFATKSHQVQPTLKKK
jgi:hypothetical protein